MGKRDGEPYPRTLVGLGDWSQADRSCIKGLPKAPVKGFRKELERHATHVVLLDEFRTSKCCYHCREVNEKRNILLWNEDKQRPLWKQDYAYLRCTNNECGRTWPRDLNSALNHLRLAQHWLMGEERPEYLCRPARKGAEYTEPMPDEQPDPAPLAEENESGIEN